MLPSVLVVENAVVVSVPEAKPVVSSHCDRLVVRCPP